MFFKKKKEKPLSDLESVQKASVLIEQSLKDAYNYDLSYEVRLQAYNTALKGIEKIINYNGPNKEKIRKMGLDTKNTIEKEKNEFIEKQMESTTTIKISPNIDAKTAEEYKAEGIKGAQWSSDPKQMTSCGLCKCLDGQVIKIDHPDFDRFAPPLHQGCNCIRIYIGKNNTGEKYTWETPPKNLVDQFMTIK